jgi:RNA polymerase sigma-70 factor (ECF subfamily)
MIEPFVGVGDEELLPRAQGGEEQAFCDLAQQHEARLFQQAVALCRNPAVAEDLVAETIVEAWKSLQRFDGSCRFSTWLYAILLHRYQKLARKLRSRPVPLSAMPLRDAEAGERLLEQLPDAGPSPADALAQAELDAPLRCAIAALPAKHQQVVLLRFYGGASLPEIATALGLSVGTVKSRLHHALEKLRKMKSIVNLSDTSGDTGT